MELLFRKYFWTVELACLALVAFLCAKIANGVIETKLLPPVRTHVETTNPRQAQASAGRPAQLDLERTAALLGIVLQPEEPVEQEAPREPAFDPDAPPVRTSLRLSLVGTMVAGNNSEWSMATIRDDNSRDTGLYLTGDTIQGAEILEIERLRVILLNGGRKEYLAVEGSGAPPPPPPPTVAATTAAPDSDDDDLEVRQIDENNFEISREEIDKQLSNLNAIATQARIVPSFKNGVANGFKVFSIRPGSLYQKIGVQNGDVIKKINGFEINSPEKALEVYSRLREASRIEIEIERRGQTRNMNYTIR